MLGCFAALWALAMTTSPTNPNPILLGPLVPFTSDHLPVAPEAALTQASEAEEFAAVSAMQLPKASVARRQAPPALSSAFLNVAACGMPAPRAGFFLAAAREPTEAHADVSALDMHRLHPLAQKSLAKLVHMLGSAPNSSLHRAAVASDSNAAEVVRPFDWIAHARSWQSAHGRRRGVSAQQMPFEQAEKALEQAAAAEAAAAQAEAAQLADAVCVGSDEDINGAGNTSLLFVLLLITIGLLVLDAVQLWATLARVPALLAASARPEPTAKPGNHDSFSDTTPTSYGLVTDRPTTCTTTATTAEEGGMSSEAPKGGGDEGGGDDTDAGGLAVHKKPPAGSADASGAAAAPSDEEPMIVDAQTWLILTLTTLPAFSSDLYFSMLAPFLPGAAEARGLPSSIVGLIFACVPIGSALAALGVPALLARPTSDAYSLIRRATLANAALVACAGLAGNVPLAAGHGVPFGATLGVIRLLQGVCCAVLDVTNSSILLRILPKSYIGPASGVLMAVRILAVIGGPVIGGLLYQSGCWALPFTAGCAALLSSALLMLLGLGRQAPPALKPRAHEMSATQLLSIGDTWLVALPTLLLSMTASFLEPSWQLYLGSPPYSLSPTNIGVFLQATTLEYLLVLVCAGFALPLIGSAVQMSLGCTLATIGLLLIGPCPLLRAHVPQTEVAVLLGTMITFGGVGLAVPALTPMALEVYEKHGYTQRQVAGVSAALFTGLINVANIGGPLLGGTLREASGGLPLATTLYGALTGGVCALCCGKLLAMYVRSRCCGVRSGRGEREM